MPQSGSNMTRTALFIRSLQCYRRPSLSTWLMACEGVALQSINPEPPRESARTGCWKVYRAWLQRTSVWRSLENLIFPLCMWPWCISPCLRMRICPCACKENLFCVQVLLEVWQSKALEMSVMAIPLISYTPEFLHHILHTTSASLANKYIRHHLSTLSASGIITSFCCACSWKNCVCDPWGKPCLLRHPPKVNALSDTQKPKQGVSGGLTQMGPSLGASWEHPPCPKWKRVESELWGFYN